MLARCCLRFALLVVTACFLPPFAANHATGQGYGAFGYPSAAPRVHAPVYRAYQAPAVQGYSTYPSTYPSYGTPIYQAAPAPSYPSQPYYVNPPARLPAPVPAQGSATVISNGHEIQGTVQGSVWGPPIITGQAAPPVVHSYGAFPSLAQPSQPIESNLPHRLTAPPIPGTFDELSSQHGPQVNVNPVDPEKEQLQKEMDDLKQQLAEATEQLVEADRVKRRFAEVSEQLEYAQDNIKKLVAEHMELAERGHQLRDAIESHKQETEAVRLAGEAQVKRLEEKALAQEERMKNQISTLKDELSKAELKSKKQVESQQERFQKQILELNLEAKKANVTAEMEVMKWKNDSEAKDKRLQAVLAERDAQLKSAVSQLAEANNMLKISQSDRDGQKKEIDNLLNQVNILTEELKSNEAARRAEAARSERPRKSDSDKDSDKDSRKYKERESEKASESQKKKATEKTIGEKGEKGESKKNSSENSDNKKGNSKSGQKEGAKKESAKKDGSKKDNAKEGNKSNEKAQSKSAEEHKIEETIKLTREEWEVRQDRAAKRISDRSGRQRQRLLDAGAKESDSQIVALDRRLKAELKNTKDRIDAEYSQKLQELEVALGKLNAKKAK